ncbi:hypothetical protein STEG23_021677, partial [Scotinomys teguina]
MSLDPQYPDEKTEMTTIEWASLHLGWCYVVNYEKREGIHIQAVIWTEELQNHWTKDPEVVVLKKSPAALESLEQLQISLLEASGPLWPPPTPPHCNYVLFHVPDVFFIPNILDKREFAVLWFTRGAMSLLLSLVRVQTRGLTL